jgi:hypothetical protein
MNSKLLAIGIPATAFVLTIAITLWRQRADEPPPAAQSEPVAPAPRQDPAQGSSFAAAQDTGPPDAAPTPTPAASPSAGNATDPRNTDAPLRFAFRNLPGESHLGVIVLNMSMDDVEARVTAVSAKTHLRSVLDVNLHGHERKNLTSAGLEAEPGDQVTVQSPPYRDLSLVAAVQ